MGVFEDIIGSLIIISLCIVVAIVLPQSYNALIISEQNFWQQNQLKKQYAETFDTILSNTDESTRRTYADLIGSSLYYGSSTLQTAYNTSIPIPERMTSLFDEALNRGYHFRAERPLEDVHLYFIIDGSDTLDDESEKLAEQMDDIVQDINDSLSLNVNVSVYHLEYPNSSRCDNFSSCTYLGTEDIYYSGKNSIHETLKYDHGLSKPSHIYGLEEGWKSDWETAMASMILKIRPPMNQTDIFIPITDSLPTSTQYLIPCPTNYSETILHRDIDIIREYNIIVNPIFSTNIDPARFCDQEVKSHMEKLINLSTGVVIVNRDNFERRLVPALEENSKRGGIFIGKQQTGRRFSIERHVPLPDGSFAPAYLIIYLQ
ncbi:MAG: hypothetical protein ACQESG_01020 [Nanobdellota archaeon]